MTTIRQKKALRQFNAPDDRLRHSVGMGDDDYLARKELSVDAVWLAVKGALVLLAMFAIYSMPSLIVLLVEAIKGVLP